MTFYQELQLNQAGSKELLRKSETAQERRYHALVALHSSVCSAFYLVTKTALWALLFYCA